MSDDTAGAARLAGHDRLSKVALNLMQHGLDVRLPLDEPGYPDAYFTMARDPVSGECAQIRYACPRDDPGGSLLELIYRTGREHDPDGAHLASRVIRLLSAAPYQPAGQAGRGDDDS